MRAATARRAAAAKALGVVQFVEGAKELSLSLEEEPEEGDGGDGVGMVEGGQLKLTRARMGGGGTAVSSSQHHHHHAGGQQQQSGGLVGGREVWRSDEGYHDEAGSV
jgi:hypothetical protein